MDIMGIIATGTRRLRKEEVGEEVACCSPPAPPQIPRAVGAGGFGVVADRRAGLREKFRILAADAVMPIVDMLPGCRGGAPGSGSKHSKNTKKKVAGCPALSCQFLFPHCIRNWCTASQFLSGAFLCCSTGMVSESFYTSKASSAISYPFDDNRHNAALWLVVVYPGVAVLLCDPGG